MADPEYYKPSKVHILLGADICEQLMLSGKLEERDKLFLRETLFGWVLIGRVNSTVQKAPIQSYHVTSQDIHFDFKKFWKLEELPEASKHTAEQKLCMEHFTETTTREETGRLVVQMPFIPASTPLGNSLTQAERRYKQLETRLKQHPETKKGYSKFIKEFIEVDHMEIIPEEEVPIEEERSYYLPHLCVFKDETSKTKLRVVFEGSIQKRHIRHTTAFSIPRNSSFGRHWKDVSPNCTQQRI